MIRHRTLLLAGAALLCLVLGASASAAAPTYTGWSTPVNLGPVVNSAAAEGGPALSGDGLSLYFTSVNRPGGLGSDDIWVSQRPSVSAAWGAPVNLGPTINTPSRDFVPAFSADGHWMFFASDRPGGFGPPTGTPTADLYQSYRADIHNDFGWQTPTNLGPNVNTAANENGNGYFDNGGHPQLYLGSDRLGPPGSADLYVSNRQADGTWGPPTRIAELSSPGTDNRPNLRQDGLEIFFYSDRAGSAGSDIWTATRASVDAPWSTPVNLGPTVNSSATDIHPYLSANGEALVFSSARPGGSGSTDIWMTTRDATPTVSGSPVSAAEGAPFSGAVATVTDPNTAAPASEYTATIDWGDGTPADTGTVSGSGGSFTISGNHTYAEEGSYTVTTSVADVDTSGNTATTTSTATIADAALTASGTTRSGVEGSPVAGVVASVHDANLSGSAADLTATINWGDGSPLEPGTISGAAGSDSVSGSHAYADAGTYTVTAQIADDGGSTATATTTVNVGFAAGCRNDGSVSGNAHFEVPGSKKDVHFDLEAKCDDGAVQHAHAKVEAGSIKIDAKTADITTVKIVGSTATMVGIDGGYSFVITVTDGGKDKNAADDTASIIVTDSSGHVVFDSSTLRAKHDPNVKVDLDES